jgi:hypothetical protein
MLVGYMRVSTDADRQVLDLQRDALLAARLGVRQPDWRLCLGRPEERVGKQCRIEAAAHRTGAQQKGRLTFPIRPVTVKFVAFR